MATALLAPLALHRHFGEPVVSAARTCVVAAAAPMPRRGERGSSPCFVGKCRCSDSHGSVEVANGCFEQAGK